MAPYMSVMKGVLFTENIFPLPPPEDIPRACHFHAIKWDAVVLRVSCHATPTVPDLFIPSPTRILGESVPSLRPARFWSPDPCLAEVYMVALQFSSPIESLRNDPR